MSQDVGQLAMISAVTVGINTVNAAKEGKDIVTPLIAGGVLFAGLSFTGQLWRWDLVNAIAGVFLVAALINRGLPLISGAVTIATKHKPAAAGKMTSGGGSF